MADQRHGGITWTEKTWNPIRGCRRISDECTRCYAEIQAARWCGPGQPYEGLAVNTPSGPRWTGVIRLIEDHLEDPLRWQKHQLVFVNSMSDLSFEDLPDEQIDQIVAVMVLADWHTFQVLTKRYSRMADYLANPLTPGRIAAACGAITHHKAADQDLKHVDRSDGRPKLRTWPIPNVWWGFSAGRQKTFDAAMPHVVRMRRHAAITWWSAEPLLEAIDCSPARSFLPVGTYRNGGGDPGPHYQGRGTNVNLGDWLQDLDWVVVGGESQRGARPMDPEWARAIKVRCDTRTDMGRPWPLAFHMKQLGGDPDPRKKLDDLPLDLRVRDYPVTAAR